MVLPYDESWPKAFLAERTRLESVLGAAAPTLHHIGSTSVAGLCAKPVIDVLVESPDLALVDEATRDLERLGYEAKGEYGIPGRRYSSRPADAGPAIHVHVFRIGNERIARHLRFRDYLRAHPVDASRYGELKRSLAARHSDDRDAYQQAKAAFIDQLMEKAASR